MKLENQIPVLNILIAEDDADDRFFFDRALSELDIATRFTAVNDGEQLMDYLAEYPLDLPDVLFLDINMDELSGIELLESSTINSQVIITTAYQEYALKGYELHITDYLLKPFTFNRFLQAVNKAQENLRQRVIEKSLDFIFVKTENRLEKIMISEILYIEGMRDYLRIHTSGKKIMTLQSFNELEQLVPAHLVCRVHKSYMVAVNKIESIERNRIKIGDQMIPVSDTYKEAFLQLINSKA